MGDEHALQVADSIADSSSFKVGDEVAVLFEGFFYRALILEKKVYAEGSRYYIHYVGWNKSHDGWVSQQTLHHSSKAPQPRRRGPRKKETPSASAAGITSLVQVNLPGSLRRELTRQSELIAAHNFKLHFPRSPNVESILDLYLEHSTEKKKEQTLFLVKVLNGLRLYFDKALGLLLLYNAEREQYMENTQNFPSVPVSKIYGAEHFLRLFVKLPELVAYEGIPKAELAKVEATLNDLLKYIEQHQWAFFSRVNGHCS